MPKLPRVTAKIFAGNAPENDLGQFGSAKNGTKITNNDISVLQELPAFTQGWSSAVISNRNYPTLQEMNSVQRIASQQIAYTLQNGMPEWDENTTYYTNQFCRVGKDFYCSKIDDNTGNNPQLATNEWELWSGGGSGGGSGGAFRNIGETVFSLLPLTDAGLHMLDGSLLPDAGSYGAFVQYIAKLYGDGTNIPAYFTTEDEFQTSVEKYGVCGKFVYDSNANTVRLPKVTGIVEGTLDPNALGELVQAGLPNLQLSINSAGAHTHTRGTMNITGSSVYTDSYPTGIFSGAFYNGAQGLSKEGGGGGASRYSSLNFDAARSWTGDTSSDGNHTHTVTSDNSIYGANSTVQPQTVKGFMYIVVANATKTEVEVDIDNIMTDVNLKANTALNNLTEAGEAHFDSRYLKKTEQAHFDSRYLKKTEQAHFDSRYLKKTEQATITDWSFPSSRYIDLSTGASGTEYTAPANGWIRFRMAVTPATEGYLSIQSTNGLAINNYAPRGHHPETYLPVRKNQKFFITYASGMTTVDIFRFYYAEGIPST